MDITSPCAQSRTVTTGRAWNTIGSVAEQPGRTVAWSARTRDRVAVALLLLAGAAHRSWVFAAHYDPLRDLISSNPGWLSMQYLTLPALTEHFAASLLYLQQAPPVPQVILALTVKAFGWPYGTAYALIGFQALLSITAALLLFRHMRRLIGTPPGLTCAIGLVFLLSPDLLVMEYNMFGQTMYEQLAMVLVLLVIWLAADPANANRPARAALLGLVTAALALTRASFSYFLVLPLGLLLVRGVRHRRGVDRRLLAAFFVGLLPHAAWSAKQAVVYGTPSISTTSWSGINAANAIVRTDRGVEFWHSIRDDGRYPVWIRAMIGKHGYVHWHPPTYQAYLPDAVKAAQDAIQVRLAGTNRQENSIGLRLLSDEYLKAGIRFRIRHPRWAAEQWLKSYDLFWRPIRDYSDQFLAPLSVFALTSRSFDLRGLWRVASIELAATNDTTRRATNWGGLASTHGSIRFPSSAS